MENKYTNVYIAEGARIVGDVTIGEGSSVWYNAVVRGDSAGVRIGKRTNVQDLACIHEDTGHPAVIGDDVTIGHGAIVHGCTVEGNAIIGMGAIILNGARIGRNCIIGAGGERGPLREAFGGGGNAVGTVPWAAEGQSPGRRRDSPLGGEGTVLILCKIGIFLKKCVEL